MKNKEKDQIHEIKNARKFDNSKPIQWFSNTFFDLLIWFDDNKENIIGFQLTYNKYEDPHAITWKDNNSYTHDKIDDGERTMKYKMSPILVSNGVFEKDFISKRFKEESVEIDRDIKNFVFDKILLYNE